MGSWDPNVSAMVNLTYVGTHLSNGKPDNDNACVTGFDEAGFIIGTSSSLFSVLLNTVSISSLAFVLALKILMSGSNDT
jgi:lysophospholipase